MCYHISFEIKLECITDFFPGLVVDEQSILDFTLKSYLNGFNHPQVKCIVKSRKDDKFHLKSQMSGFLPSYIRDYEAAKKFWNGYTNIGINCKT